MPDGSRSFELGDPADPQHLTALYRAHCAYVWRVLRHCGVPDDDLDDAVQETFLVVFRRLGELRGSASLRTWIYAVAVRVASTRRRSQRREAQRRDRAGADMHGSPLVDPEAALSRAEAADVVDALLDELDPPKRTVFVLAEIEGVKVPEISRILGVNPRTVHSRLRLARECFGSALRRLDARERGDRRIAKLRPRALLQQAAQDRPARARRVAAGVAVVSRVEQGAVPSLPGWSTIAPSSSLGAWTLPTIAVAVGLAGAVGLGLTGQRPSEARERGRVESTTAVGRAEPSPSSGVSAPIGEGETAIVAGPSPVEVVPDAVAVAPTIPSPSLRVAPSRSPLPADASLGEPESEPRPEPTPDASSLADETRLLEQARAALRRGQTDAVLRSVDEHLRRHPQGLLVDEARSTRLRALCGAGREDEARADARRWSSGATPSRWDDVIAAACR